MDRTGSLGSSVHPSEHAVRITFNSPEGQQPNASRLVIKTIQAHATFKRAVLLPDEHGFLPEKSYQPQFWFMKLTVPKGLPLQKGTSVDGIRLKPDGRQFGSDGCKDALKEVSSISLKRCHYVHTQWLEDPDVAVSHTWNRDRYPEWVTTAQLLRRLCEDFMARFVYHTSYMYERDDAWSWLGDLEALLTESIKVVQFYVSYSLQAVMVVLANHPGHLVRDIGEDSMNTAINQRMKDLRGWVYDQGVGEDE